MTLDERRQAFEAASILAAGERNRIQADTVAEVTRLLRQAESEIVARLEAQPTEYESFALPQLRREIERVLREFAEDAGSAATAGQGTAYDAGQALIDAPLAAAGIQVSGMAPRIDRGQLLAMQSFLTGKMRDVGLDVLNRVNTELALTMIGSQGVGDTVGRVQEIMGGISRRRATTIVRTELGRAFATASQARAEEAAQAVPGLKKQWRRSGKIHSRRKHDLTDGQVRPVDKPFILGTGRVAEGQESGGIRIMHPHDPAAPPSETINCGCISLPYLESWDGAGLLENPGKKPFSAEEIRLNPVKQELAEPGPTIGEILGRRAAKALPDVLESPRGRRALRGIESAIVGQKNEWLIVTDQHGKVLTYAEGEPEQVSVPPGQGYLLKDAILTHNHPGIAAFSPNDLAVAMSHEVRELRAIDTRYEYSLKPGRAGWSQEFFNRTALPAYERIEAEVIGKLLDALSAGKITEQTLDETRDHLVIRRLSRELGLRYRRRIPRGGS